MVEYEIEGQIVVIKGCSDEEVDITIPDYIEGLPVAKVCEYAFFEKKNLTRVVFPKTMRVICSYAFVNCKNLKDVIFAEGIELIQDWAFLSCNIEDINLPISLKKIGENAFMGNKVKAQIDEYNSKKQTAPKKRKVNHNIAIFPIGLSESISNLTDTIVKEKSQYQHAQLDSLEKGAIKSNNLDIPYVFDQGEFIVAIVTPRKLDKFSFDLGIDSRKILGNYDVTNPDFLLLTCNVMAEGRVLGEVVIKTPYLEDAKFEVTNVSCVEYQGFTYYLEIKADLACFGSGNPNRNFAFNLYKELEGKYTTQLQSGLLTERLYNKIREKIRFEALDTVKSFFKQISGAPKLKFVIALFEAVLADPAVDKKEVKNFIYTNLENIYNTMFDYFALEEICFNTTKTINFLKKVTGLNLDELKAKYNVYLADEEGKEYKTSIIEGFREVFVDNESNFTLYSDYLVYMYDMMQRLNEEFSLYTYQE